MKPMVHALSSARRFGGKPDDYLAIHDWFDSTKAALPDIRHRVILHNAFGCFLAEQVFGHTLVNSDGKTVHVRDVAEQHVIEDLGFIPTIERCLEKLPIEPWMAGGIRRFQQAEREREANTQPVLVD
jgi:hypothetical protein